MSEAIERFRDVVRRRLGLVFEDGRTQQLAELLQRRADQAGVSQEQWIAAASVPGSRELRGAVPELTVTETSFFRHKEVLRAFTDHALPTVLPGRRGRLRVLCAGCSSGEEPGTVAILVRQHAPGAELALQAVDVNPAILERARAGRYSEWALRETPPEVRQRWFRAEGREFVLDPEVVRLIGYEERNLADDDPVLWAPSSREVVFCRNVLMYLHPDVQRAVVARIARALVPRGCLFLGHAETLRGLSQDFHLRQAAGAFWYERRGATDSEAASAPRSATPPETGPGPAAGTGWMDEILAASERIRALAGRPVAADPAPRAVSARSGDPDLLLLRAAMTTNSGDRAEAERLCAEILARDELSAGAHYLMALCRERAGDLAGATEHDRSAAHLDPGFAMPWLHQGMVARKLGDAAAARQALARALALLEREDPARILLFGGGFARDALLAICRGELRSCGAA